jgi:uncharacterized protein involved in exopolysaccharide biosynthesis
MDHPMPSRHDPAATLPGATPDRFSYLALLVEVLRHRRLLLLVGLVTAAVLVAATLLRPRSWTVETQFTPQSRRQAAGLSGLAAQFGLTLPGLESNQSPQFFEALLRTHALVRRVVEGPYALPPGEGADSGSLMDFYRLRRGAPQERLAAAEAKLRANAKTAIDPKTGIVLLRVTSTSPEVSLQVSRRYLELLDRFNRESRQSQASAERIFTEQRLAQARVELREAEDRLLGFLERNRSYSRSSESAFQEDRLRRELVLQQQVFSTLAQSFEQSRIEEVRDTPVITLVEAPSAPLLPDRRWLLAKVMLGYVGGILLGIIAMIAWAIFRGTAELDPVKAGELDALRREALRDLTRPWRLFGVGTRAA